MDRLLKHYRRTAFFRFFEGLEPSERQFFWVMITLVFAIAISFSYIAHAAIGTPREDAAPAWHDPDTVKFADDAHP